MRAGTDEVVVTGLGATTPLGGDAAATWAALLAGRSGARALTEEWAAGLPARVAATAAVDPAGVLGRTEARRLDRAGRFALVALREAWADAGFTGPAGGPGLPDPDRVGVAVGSGIGGLTTLLASDELLRTHRERQISPFAVPMLMANGSAGLAALELNARAGAHAPATACAAGAEAVAAGLDMIRLGRADVVAVGGTEAMVHPLTFTAFAAMNAMSRRNDAPRHASRPYDKQRDGFVLGEGAAVLVLESARHARARGARVHCVLAGAGTSSDAHHMVRPEPGGRGMARALGKALEDGGLRPADIGYVGTHATSTQQGDLAESRALCSVLGTGGYAVSATKSATGHLIGAAGALGAVLTVRALSTRTAPPTINVDDPDDAIELDVVRGAPRPLPAGRSAALSNCAAFGGHNVVLAFRTES
ncbi:beta-ketoacyl-[acyl-carrier-protein] synthase family protein [Streptomyces nondiastaticus]|uniref:beta-ketoacyl-[acyl-carrier-protein] synthase family protein n=1 Tax=Streptomyces nondiastaticus TaxID=3154512 RepID=UPI00341CF48E